MTTKLSDFAASLVAFLVANAKDDQTAPPTWFLDTILQGVEKYVLHGFGLPVEFAEICRQASVAPEVTDPAARLLLRLGQVNGLRRVVASHGEVEGVKTLFADIKAEIVALPNGPRQERLIGFWYYQVGVFAARNGLYAEATEQQNYTAVQAKNRAEREIAIFLAKVYGLWAAFVEGDEAKIERALAANIVEYRELEEGVKGTPHETQWGLGNGPIHLLQAYLWAGIEIPAEFWDELSGKIKQAAAAISAFAEWAEVLEVVSLVRGGQQMTAIIRTNGIAATSTDATVLATLRLIKARILRAADQFATAREHYAEIKSAPDCHQVAAVAVRELAELPPA